MNDKPKAPSIAHLERRIVKGRVIAVDEDVIHLALEDNPIRADCARVREQDLPKDRPAKSFRKGDVLDVFIEKPSAVDPKLWHANALWADNKRNPWLTGSLKTGEEVRGTAHRYVEDFGVKVRLENGVEAMLHREELPFPRSLEPIWESIHLGDHIAALIKTIDIGRLEVSLSVRGLLHKRRKEYEQNKTPPFTEEEIEEPRTSPGSESCLLAHPALFQGVPLLLIDDNHRFSQAFKEWMEILGARVTLTRDYRDAREVLAKDRPDHVLLDFDLNNRDQEQQIHKLLQGRRDLHVGLISGNYVQARSLAHQAGWRFLPKPLGYAALKAWIEKDSEPELLDLDSEADSKIWRRTVEERFLIIRADDTLAEICAPTACLGALWIRRERPGVYAVLAKHGIHSGEIKLLERQLGNSLVRTVIEHETEQEQEAYRSGPLYPAAPSTAHYIWALPVEIEGHTNDALVFFRDTPFDSGTKKVLREQRLRVVTLSERLTLISHMHEVESFAVFGRVAASLLHEIRGAINPVAVTGSRLEKALDTGLSLSDIKSELRELIQRAQRVAKLACIDLRTIQKQQREWIHVPDTIERIVKLMRAVALGQGAALEIKGHIPPVTINLQPQVLEQPLINLLDNALFYSRNRSWAHITLSACVASDDTLTPLHIWVEDNGLGMTAEQRDQLFSLRVSAKDVEGVGLSLYVSRNLLQAVGGDLVLEDTARWFGSRLCIRLPMIL